MLQTNGMSDEFMFFPLREMIWECRTIRPGQLAPELQTR